MHSMAMASQLRLRHCVQWILVQSDTLRPLCILVSSSGGQQAIIKPIVSRSITPNPCSPLLMPFPAGRTDLVKLFDTPQLSFIIS